MITEGQSMSNAVVQMVELLPDLTGLPRFFWPSGIALNHGRRFRLEVDH